MNFNHVSIQGQKHLFNLTHSDASTRMNKITRGFNCNDKALDALPLTLRKCIVAIDDVTSDVT